MSIDNVPRYHTRNLCQQHRAFDPEHDNWAVIETVGTAREPRETIVEEYGIKPANRIAERAPDHKRADKRAAELNRQSYEKHIANRKFTRYLTRSYVSIALDECKRHAAIDKTPVNDIKIAFDVSIMHYAGSWMLWSDRFTTGIGISLPSAGVLTPAAKGLISTVRGADGGSVEGGILTLAKIADIISETAIAIGPSRGIYHPETIEQLHVRWLDGSESDLFAASVGYFEGYQYDIYNTIDAARAALGLAPSSEGISIFPADDFDYDSRLGYIGKEPA